MVKNSLVNWLGYARIGATVQSVMPAVLTVILACGEESFNLFYAILAVVGVWSAHLAMNLADDYYDYKADMLKDKEKVVRRGIKAYTAKYPYLTDESASIADLQKTILCFLAVAGICGIVIAFAQGWEILLIALLAGFLGTFYSAPPIKFCYWGMGEVVTGIIFGPLLMEGVWWATTGNPSYNLLYISIPIGLLVINILFTHSFIDKEGDLESDKLTLASLLRTNTWNLCMSALLNFLPFVCIVVGVALGILHPAYLVILLMLPRAIWLFWSLCQFAKDADFSKELEKPRWFLGQMGNWQKIREAGLDWFLIRWLTARNLVSGYCLIIIVVRILLLWLTK